MTLSEKSRTTLYRHFEPSLGEEVTSEMLSCFPATSDDRLVTESTLRISQAEIRAEIAELRTEMHDSLRSQTRWLTGVVISSLLGGLTLAAGVATAISSLVG